MTNTPINLAEYGRKHPTRSRGSEDGSVRLAKTKKKQWEGIYHAYVTLPDGKTRRDTRYRIIGACTEFTKTQAREEHRNWCRNFHSAPLATNSTGPRKATVADIAADYLVFKKGDWSPRTAVTMAGIVNHGIVPALGSLPLKTVTAEHLRTYVHSLPGRTHAPQGRMSAPAAAQVRAGASHSYVEKTIVALRTMFALAQERDLIVKNPAESRVIPLTKPRGIPAVDKSVFAPEQLPALLTQLDARDTLIVWISILGATRPGELFAIHGNDVGPGYVAIRHALDEKRKLKATKTEKDRIVSLPPQLNEELQEWIRWKGVGPDDLLFQNLNGGPVDRGYFITKVLRPAAKRAKIAATRLDFRMLRRSFSTIAAAIGFDVKSIQTQLGHAKPNMSYGEYVQPVDSQRQAHMAALENILRGRAPMPYDLSKKLGSDRLQ